MDVAIPIMMDIFKVDSDQTTPFGGAMNASKKQAIFISVVNKDRAQSEASHA